MSCTCPFTSSFMVSGALRGIDCIATGGIARTLAALAPRFAQLVLELGLGPGLAAREAHPQPRGELRELPIVERPLEGRHHRRGLSLCRRQAVEDHVEEVARGFAGDADALGQRDAAERQRLRA